MLTRGLQAAIAGRLAGDAWFSDPARGVAVVPQDRGDAAAVVRSSLARCGCGGEIEEVRLLPGRTRREFELRVTVRFGERPVAARAGGNFRTAQATGLKALALLLGDYWQPAEYLTPLTLVRFEPEGRTEDGVVVWGLELACHCTWTAIATVLGDGVGEGLSDGRGAALEMSPTGA